MRHQRETGGPRLMSSTGAWTYTDPAEHQTALQLDIEHGISLPAIDDWIAAGPWSDQAQRARVLEWRAMLLECQKAGNSAAAEGWGMFMLTLVHHNLRVQFLQPLAQRGRRHGEQQARRRKDKPGTDPDKDLGRNDAIRRMHRQLVGEGHTDATARVGQEFELSTRRIRQILAN